MTQNDPHGTEECNLARCAAGLESLPSVTWDRDQEASSDGDLHTLQEMAVDGLPDLKANMPESLHAFHQYREHITSTDGMILYKDRVVIPPSLCDDVLSALHAAHQGISMMTTRTEYSVFCPGMTADIRATRGTETTATGWHPHSMQHRLSHSYLSSTLSRPYVMTSLSTEGFTTL